MEFSEPIYHHISTLDCQLHLWIPKTAESFQLLHHVTAYDAKKGLLLVGNKSEVMYGLFIKYPAKLKRAYLAVLDDLYESRLAWAYGPINQLPEEKIRAVLDSPELKDHRILYNAFHAFF